MPRLVSLTLLSVLVLPAAALIYTLIVVIGETFFWQWSTVVWSGANVLSFALVVGWWTLLWRRSVEWTAQRIALTLLATAFSMLAGFAVYLLVNYRGYGGIDFSSTTGGATAGLCWLVCACILWRGGGQSSDAGADRLVVCPRCGYALNGLREARCPECGEVYTLDALLRAQPSFGGASDLAAEDAGAPQASTSARR